MSARARTLALCALLAMATACAGPQRPVDIGIKEIATDVLIGPGGATLTPTPPPSSVPAVGFPGLVEPPLPRFPQPQPLPSPDACPSAAPFAPVRHTLRSTATAPPHAASYDYRNDGSYTVGGKTYAYAARSTRAIEDVQTDASGGGYSFDIAAPQPDGSVTTTAYHVYPTQPSPSDPAPGMYIVSVTTKYTDGSAQTFDPTPALQVIPFPASVGTTWSSRGIDPLAQIVMQFDAAITATPVIDACGTRVTAWQVDISNGSIRSPTTDLTFTGTLDVGPQYGGVFLLDALAMKGTDNGAAVDIHNTARIAQEPQVP